MSPVWIMKAGFFGSALTLAMASSSVPSAFGLAGLSKPTWLSLICRKVRPCASCACRLADDAERVGNAAGNGPQHAGSDPGHAFQDFAPADAVIAIGFRSLPVSCYAKARRRPCGFRGRDRATAAFIPGPENNFHGRGVTARCYIGRPTIAAGRASNAKSHAEHRQSHRSRRDVVGRRQLSCWSSWRSHSARRGSPWSRLRTSPPRSTANAAVPAFASALVWIGSGFGGILMGRVAERVGIRWTVIGGARDDCDRAWRCRRLDRRCRSMSATACLSA